MFDLRQLGALEWRGEDVTLLSCHDSHVENVKVFVLSVQTSLSPAKFPSNCFLLNLVLNCASESLVNRL